MKKLLLLFVLISGFAFGQSPTEFTLVTNEGLSDFVVTEVPDKSAAEIYQGTLDWLQKLFGKVKQVKEGVTIRRNETTINMNEQMDFVIPASKISSLQAGTLVGQVALDFGQEDNFPTAMYHCKTNLDLKKIKKEEEAYKELPKVYNFGTADNREKLLQKNFKRIYDEVETVIEQYV